LLTTGANGDDDRIARAFEQALARPPQPKELRSLTTFLTGQREYYRAHSEDAEKLLAVGRAPAPASTDRAELAAWTSLARVVLNLHEVITRY
jgi:hypothetical protein